MDLATRLREREFAAVRVQLEGDLRENLLKSLDERGGAQELVRQQYSGRYPFELLQNANDAAVDAGIRGRAYFLLTDTALIVADDGSGFGDRQVGAICSLGRSSKGPGTAVGHKGLGFKSVGEITDCPQVVSAQTSFQFDGERLRREMLELLGTLPAEQRFPVYAFPFPVAEAELGPDAAQVRQLQAEGFRTIIRLPLREGVDRQTVAAHLVENLRPRLLLFLPGIDRLDLHGTLSDFSATVVRREDCGAEHVVLDAGGSVQEWLIYRSEATPERGVLEPLGEAWTRLKTVRWAVAVPLDEACQPRTDETFPLHVYFPTEEVPGLHVMVHAEWVLGMDRRQLAATPEAEPYNRVLLAHVVAFLENHVAFDLVVRSGASAAAVGAVVPAAKPASAGAGSQLRQLWEEALRRTRFLPIVDGSLARPADVCLLPPRMPSLAQAHALAVLDRSRTLRPDIEELAATKKFLMSGSVTSVMEVGEFLALLKPPSHDSIGAYYGFLLKWRDQVGQQLVTKTRITASVLTTSGQLVTPAEQPIFFPRGRSDSSIPDDIPVPIAEVPPIEGVEGLLKDLGVKPFEWRELIRDFLAKILVDPEADPDDRLRAMSGLRAYHRVRLSGSEELAPVLGRVLVPVRSADGTRQELRAGAEVYFGADWTRSNDLETLYGPFGRAEFLDVEVPQDADRRQVDMGFYRMLGVADHPRLDEAKPAEAHGYMLIHYRHPHRGPLFWEWMAQPDVEEAAHCPQGHPQTQQLQLSYRLDRHLDLIESRDEHRLFVLWRQFAQRWGTIYEPAMEAVFRCVHRSHSGDRERTCESLFAYTLRSRPWVPVSRGAGTDVVRPEEAWVDATDTPRRIKERIPRIAETMYQMRGGAALVAALGLTDAGRPKVKDLLVLLEGIAAEADELGDTDREIELAARYVQRTLDDVLGDEPNPHPAPETVRVLASHNGRSTFVAQPPVADDPLLRDTWERRFPVLSAEARLNRLVRYLSLTKLDSAVTASPMPYGHHFHDAPSTAVHSLLDDVKPYLLALARAENPRAEATARNALKRLELVICDSLVLRYEYAGVTVERDDAVCYIATRPEQRGARTYQIGTAYLELDPTTGAPHWFPFGRQLAQHLGTPALADAVTMLLTARADDRQRMMADRQIRPEDITETREQLGLITDDDEPSNILDSLLSQADRQAPAPPVNTTVAPPPPPMSPPPSSTPVAAKPNENRQESPTTTPLATVDYSKVRIVDGQLGQLVPPSGGNSQSWVSGGISTAPSIQSEEEKRQIGKRGEEVAFHKERERLREAGKNPDLVVWVSKDDELSPFDIQSVDADDQVIYIEVKSTKADNPEEPFYLSQAELLEASLHGSRYYIYRVTNATAEAPTITRVADPLRKIKEGRGRLLLDRARMTLAFSNTSE